ncbi:MAG: hypothetical protein AAB728_05290 [Patescibacteria group bacterium]
MHINLLDPKRFHHTMFWSVLLCALIVGIAATLARATLTLSAALTDKPDIAIYLLLEEKGVGRTQLLRETYDTRDYLAETEEGPKFVRLKKGFRQWYVELEENLHE